MLRRLWLLFAQATTIGLAALFIVATLKPEWLRKAPPVVSTPLTENVAIQRAATPEAGERVAAVQSYAEAARRAMPAVVSVYTTKELRRGPSDDPLFERFFGNRGGERSFNLGSGVIATADGYILTNNHVVEAADQIAVKLADGREVEAQAVGADPETDLAVLKVPLTDLPAITFGRAENLKVGDVVLAIGNPFDVGQTVTMGIVSALGRNDLGINRYENFIQTDAAINQGNSGGALVDTNGLLVGINSAIYSRTGGSVGIGFAIPASIVTQVMEQLIRTGKVTRGYFGIEPGDVTPELAELLKLPQAKGVVVRGVQRGAPAGKAGMEPLDVILTINGQPVVNTPGLLAQIAQLAPGTVAKVKVLRKGTETELDVTVGERPPPRTAQR
ncbi:MAG TPA: trypsin-like peptidase domain-containing protein [Burkholderiaceae bacterium]|nr:trypsin-like peptidase domain-containing protein [Burkholderiaceae bacterium]